MIANHRPKITASRVEGHRIWWILGGPTQSLLPVHSLAIALSGKVVGMASAAMNSNETP